MKTLSQYILSFVIGAIALSLFSILEKTQLGINLTADTITLVNFLLPLGFGGLAGVIIFTAFIRQTNKINHFKKKITHLENNIRSLSSQLNSPEKAKEISGDIPDLSNLDISDHQSFMDHLNTEWRRALRNKSPISAILCSIDNYHICLEKFGRDESEDCLNLVNSLLQQRIKRPADRIIQWDDNKCLIILPDTPLDGATHIAQNLRKELQQLNIIHPEENLTEKIETSLAVASHVPDHITQPDHLITALEHALAKAQKERLVVIAEKLNS